MVNHPIVLAVIVGMSYFLIWGGYRLTRRRQYRQYHYEHKAERLRRAKADYAIDDARLRGAEHRGLERDEAHRRAEWDAGHGPLMAPLQLSEREESRWPVGAALQGATAITASLLIAGMIWSRVGHGPAIVEPTTPPTVVTTSLSAVAVPVSVFMAAIFAISGVVLLCLSPSRGRQIAGASLLTLSLLSGLKILPIDSIISMEDLTLVRVSRNHSPPLEGYSLQTLSLAVENMVLAQFPWDKVQIPAPPLPPVPPVSRVPPPPFFHSITLPPFQSGSAELDNDLRCALCTLARSLAEDEHLSSIIVVGKADRRELRPTARRKYATNWGLAQQRAMCVEKALRAIRVKTENILVITAGPVLTLHSMPATGLNTNRAVTVLIAGSGTKQEHPWTEAFERNKGYRDCNKVTEVPVDLCRGPFIRRDGM
jgi:outer membrane protein OmpA-like peptidoglycan-associated protein